MTDLHDPRFATTLARGLSVLRAFRVTDDGLSNGEIAQRTGLPKSTVSRLTFTLGQLGYLVQSPRDDRFRPGPTLVAVGHVAAASLSFLVPAHDLMQRLAEETGTLVVLAVRDGDKLVLIRTWRPTHVASIWLEVGQRIPLQPFSSPRAFIAAATPAEIEHVAAEHPAARQALDLLLQDRAPTRAALAQRGFVSTPAGSGSPAAYNAVSVPIPQQQPGRAGGLHLRRPARRGLGRAHGQRGRPQAGRRSPGAGTNDRTRPRLDPHGDR